jgi:hypothetical protein
MLEKESIQLQSLAAHADAEKLVVKVRIHNPEDRTLYAYGTVRRYLYDAGTKRLTLCLHDGHLSEDDINSRHMPEPRMVALEQHADTELALDLPAVVHRIRGAAERQGEGPLTEDLPIAEATEIRLEVAHQDTPFYFNPAQSRATQLREWGRQVAVKTLKVGGGQGGKHGRQRGH